jgi:hypothetical protein
LEAAEGSDSELAIAFNENEQAGQPWPRVLSVFVKAHELDLLSMDDILDGAFDELFPVGDCGVSDWLLPGCSHE